jgi:hypothetical protein
MQEANVEGFDKDHARQALQALAAWQPRFADPGFEFGRWFRLTEGAQRFVQDCSDHGWIRGDLDWGTWAATPEAQRLRDDPAAIATADADDLAKLLTVAVRADRFSEGELLGAWESGLLRRIVDRAATLAAAAEDVDG